MTKEIESWEDVVEIVSKKILILHLQFVYVAKLTQFTGITDGCLNYLHNSSENYLRFPTKVVGCGVWRMIVRSAVTHN